MAVQGIAFSVLLLDCIIFGMMFPYVAALLAHFRAHEGSGWFSWAAAQAQALVPTADPVQRDALFGGVIIGLYSLMQFVSAPLWGRLSDRIGRRPVLLWSLAVTCAANLVWALSDSFAALVASRVIAGAFSGSVVGVTAAIGDAVPAERRARAMGLVGMAFGLGFVAGPLLGALLHHPQALAGVWILHEFSLPALVGCVLGAVNLGIAWRRFPETLDRSAAPAAPPRTANVLAMFRGGGQSRAINFAFCAYTLLFSGMEATLVFVTAQRYGFTPFDNGWLFLVMGLSTAVMQGAVFRPLAPRLGIRRLGVAGIVVSMVGFAALAYAADTAAAWALWGGAGLLAAGSGLIFPALSTLASLVAERDRMGESMGYFRSAGSLGRAVGPYVGAVAFFAIAPSGPSVISAVGLMAPLALLLWAVRSPATMR